MAETVFKPFFLLHIAEWNFWKTRKALCVLDLLVIIICCVVLGGWGGLFG